ncbi:IS3 family transposase [Streptomyces sp. NPDC017943]|uniref:IS3 family transposase n=1 Tax=Streptomyces sp. NPDC017943 TaxID=3365019 RepID=UPI0037BC85CB
MPLLRRAGRVVNAKRVERLMREHCIAGITRRRRCGLTRQAKRAVFAADLIRRDFTAPRPGMRLAGDMTELVTAEGKACLATCIDLATREPRWRRLRCGLRRARAVWSRTASCTPIAGRNTRVTNSTKRYGSWA